MIGEGDLIRRDAIAGEKNPDGTVQRLRDSPGGGSVDGSAVLQRKPFDTVETHSELLFFGQECEVFLEALQIFLLQNRAQSLCVGIRKSCDGFRHLIEAADALFSLLLFLIFIKTIVRLQKEAEIPVLIRKHGFRQIDKALILDGLIKVAAAVVETEDGVVNATLAGNVAIPIDDHPDVRHKTADNDFGSAVL